MRSAQEPFVTLLLVHGVPKSTCFCAHRRTENGVLRPFSTRSGLLPVTAHAPRGREQPFPFSISGLFFILYFSCVAIRAIIVADLVCAGSLSMHSPAPLSDPFGLSDSALFYIDGSFSQSCKGSAFPNLRCAAMRRAARCRERCTVTKNMNRGNQNQL